VFAGAPSCTLLAHYDWLVLAEVARIELLEVEAGCLDLSNFGLGSDAHRLLE